MMLEKKTTEFLDVLSSKEPVPGGGGAGALGMMVANLTIGKKKYAGVEEEIKESLEHLRGLQKELIRLTDADAEAFEPLAKAYGLPKETPEQKAHKEAVMETALYEASLVPLEIMETIAEVMEELELLGEKGSRLALSDVGVGILFAQAALEGASLNVFINTGMMKDRERAEALDRQADRLIEEGGRKKEQIYQKVLKQLRQQ